MTLAVQTPRQLYNCNGSTTTFAIPFAFSSNSQVEVILVDTDTDVETAQTIVTHYTISGSNVETTSTHASDKKLLIRMNKALEQQLADFTDNTNFLPTVAESADDYQASLVQQLNERIDRCLAFPKTSTHANINLPRTIDDEVVPLFADDGTVTWLSRDELVGDTGPQGNTGPTGATGATGATGPQGDPGVSVGGTAIQGTLSGTFGTDTVYTLPQTPLAAAEVIIFLGSTPQIQTTNYTISGTIVTFPGEDTTDQTLFYFFRY